MSFLHENNSYFSITELLVTEERLTAVLQQPLPKLGFLSASSKDADLQRGAKLELPLWLASALCSKRSQLVSCEPAKIYRESYREILQADACAVELAKWSQYYYELGLKLARNLQTGPSADEENRRMSEFLLDVFRARFRIIMDAEQNPFTAGAAAAHLPLLERKLLEQGNAARQQLLNWMVKADKRIQTSSVLSNIRKRKRMEA